MSGPPSLRTIKRRGRPGPALTIGLPVLALVGAGYWIYPELQRQAGAPANASAVSAPGSSSATAPGGPVTFRVAGDPWSGYSTFRNEPRFTAGLAKHQITLEYLDDEKYYDQDQRMRALAEGELDLALTTLDAFLQHGANHRRDGLYPGVILFGIDESAGGDAIFLGKGLESFDDVKPNHEVCFAQGTPSEHLWDFATLAFTSLAESLKPHEALVAKDCWEKLTRDEVQVAVLWQPYTAIAEKQGYEKVFATGGQADDVIFDLVLANRKVLREQKPALVSLASEYFKTIDGYQRDRDEHGAFVLKDCGPDCDGKPELGEAVISGIDFLTLEENLCLWFGLCDAPNKLAPRIGKTGKLLIAKQKLDPAALPDPATIVDDSLLAVLKQERLDAAKLAAEVSGPDTQIDFPTFAVRDPEYDYVVAGAEGTKGVGTLELPNVFFREGGYGLGEDAKATVASIADQLRSFPALCVRITGFTNAHGDPVANRKLSRYRALSIAAELNRIDPKAFPMKRFEVVGLGVAPSSGNAEADVRASRRTEFTLFNCTS